VQAIAGRHRVLVIEDDPALAEDITAAVSGYDVTVAHTAARGLALAAAIGPDVVVLDARLPDRSSRERTEALIEALRDAGRAAKILLVGGSAALAELAEWVAYSADDFLAVPFAREALRGKLDRLLWRQATERRIARQHEELVALHAQTEREADAARVLLDRLARRASIDPAHVRIDALSAGAFCGDAVFAHPVAGGGYRWLVGDATGHTLASALVTIPIATIFYVNTLLSRPLAHTLRLLDEEVHATLPVTMFFAATLCELSADRRTLSVANAGMPDLLIRRADGRLDAIASDWPPFGVRRAGTPTTPIDVAVTPGDRVYAFTDGLTEVRDPAGALFGIERVRAILGAGDADGAFHRLAASWRAHAGGADPEDDITLVELRI
jgi:serine phosphatase RsbU (regulator of sigma subunit)